MYKRQVIDSAIDTPVDVDDTNLKSATVTISNNLVTGDALSGTYSSGTNFTYSFVSPTLTITAAGGGKSLAEFDAALQSVTFVSTSNDPTSAARTLSWVLTDDDDASSAARTSTVNVTPANDAPSQLGAVDTLAYTQRTMLQRLLIVKLTRLLMMTTQT